MRKHLPGMILFALIVGATLYLYTPPKPAPRPPGPAFAHLSAATNTQPAAIIDVPKREAHLSFALPEGASDGLWARVEFSSPDSGAPRWTTPPVHITPGRQSGPVLLTVPCEPCRSIAPQTNYYARVIISETPDGEAIQEVAAAAPFPVLVKHR